MTTLLRRIALASSAPFLAISCATTDRATAPVATPAAIEADTAAAAPSRADPAAAEPLTLDAALRLADAEHPRVAAARARLEESMGAKLQAGLLPNPKLSVLMETARFSGRTTGDAEYIVGVSEEIPVGGRLSAATAAKAAHVVELTHELEAVEREVRGSVRAAFAAALYSQKRRQVLEAGRATAEDGRRIAQARVSAGDATADEVARAVLEVDLVRVDLLRADGDAARTLAGLRAALGNRVAVQRLDGAIEESLSIDLVRAALTRLAEEGGGPWLDASRASVDRRRAEVVLAEAERIPDVGVELAYRRIGDEDADAFDVGLSLPLPLFDRRQGRIAQARAAALEAEARHAAATADVELRLAELRARLEAGLEAAALYRSSLLPRSLEIVRVMEARFAAGDVSLGDVLPARRDALRLELEHLATLRDVALAWSELREMAASALITP